MNRSSPQPSPDDLDRAFSQFFRAQMPTKWPAAPIPADVAPARTTGLWRTRLTLGASVAALLAIGFAVSYGPSLAQPNKPGDNGFEKNGVADGDKMKKLMQDPPIEVVP